MPPSLTRLGLRGLMSLLSLVIVLVTSAAHAQTPAPASARNFGQGLYRTTLFLSQHYSLQGELTGSGKVAPMTASRLGYGPKVSVSKVVPSSVAMLPRVNVAKPSSRAVVETTLGYWFADNAADYTKSVAQWLKSRSISHGFFSYTQDILIATSPGASRRMQIYWSGVVDSGGKAMYGRPRIIDADPLIVDVTYWPRTVDGAIPSGWVYPNAGKAQWRLLNKNFEAVTGYAEMDLAGAFDADLSEDEGPLKCLVDNRNAGCAPGFDIRKLILDNGASGAILQYAQKVAPVYEAVDTGAEDAEARPVTAYVYEDRILTCDKLINKGAVGYALEANIEQFFVTPNEPAYTAEWIGHSTQQAISETADFTVEAPLALLGGVHPSGVLLSPLQDGALWPLGSAEASRAVYVAPLRTEEAAAPNANVENGDTRLVSVRQGDLTELTFETLVREQFLTGTWERQFSLDLANPSELSEFALTEQHWDDFIFIQVNGRAVFTGPLAMPARWPFLGSTSDAVDMRVYGTAGSVGVSGPEQKVGLGSFTVFCGWDGLFRRYCDLLQTSGAFAPYVSSGSFDKYSYVDLRPYLHAGQNIVKVKLITAHQTGRFNRVDKDGFSVKFRLSQNACGAAWGVQALPPPPPATAARSSLFGALRAILANRP